MCPLCSPPSRLPGPAQLEIERGHPESRAQLGELAHGGQALARDLAEHGVRRHHQEGGRAPLRAAHAAAELVELGQPVAVGPVDDHGVRARDVEAVLDDGGGHEHVRPALHEGEHRLLQLRLRHLPVGDGDARLRHQLLHHVGEGVDRFHAVVHEVDLAVAGQLLPDGGGDRRPSRTSRSRSGWPAGPWAGSR